jgi:hypothetical protein
MEHIYFQKFGEKSDKVYLHGYHRIHPWFLNHFYGKKNVAILEIGIHESNSIPIWNLYFDVPEIHGIDIKSKTSELKNVFLHQVDQSSGLQLEEFSKEKINKFQIIIDDGSHVPSHQAITIKKLWKTLKDGGIYIIEDIETSYWGKSSSYGYKFNSKSFSLISELLKSIPFINNEFTQKNNNDVAQELKKIFNEIEMISFAYNCVIIIKKNKDFNEYYNREYAAKKNINKKSSLIRVLRFLKRIFK